MNKKRSRFGAAILSIAALVGMTGCIGIGLGKVTGRGTIPSAYQSFASPETKATFGFDADSCAGAVTGRFNYQDNYFPVRFDGKPVQGGVKMAGIVTEAVACLALDGGYYLCETCRGSFGCSPPFYAIAVEYRSANPFAPGEGLAYACVPARGDGERAFSTDQLAIRAESGPFSGYANKGEAKGYLQSYPCE